MAGSLDGFDKPLALYLPQTVSGLMP